MAGDAVGGEPRYWAFISYSHRDAAFGRLLHRQLESYYLPRRLVGRSTAQGIVPRRLVPIFRDREEFPASSDLSAEVRAALSQSHSLVVVCSPSAAASKWVSREVELFHELHPDRPVFAALHDGDPALSFPEAMLGTTPNGERIEPLAADFRPHCDGTHLGLLKLVAGITGVGLDELVQRDAQRYRQRVTAITAAALATVLVMGALTVAALEARKEAERQRGEAEGLVEYMLTDLRDRLKGVGRLDVMTAVNQRALHYYEDQDLASLPVDSLERRARILHAMGEDDENRGDNKAALLKFLEAKRTTEALLEESPNDPERTFDQAQSVYWIGYEEYQQGRIPEARTQFLAYRDLAARMIALAPGKTKYRLELAYAESNLCSLALGQPYDRNGAIRHCTSALADANSAALNPDKENRNERSRADVANLVMNAHANLADADLLNNNVHGAQKERGAEARLLDGEMAADPNNMDLKNTWIIMQRAMAHIEQRLGQLAPARARLAKGIAMADEMSKYDHNNHLWAQLRQRLVNDMNDLDHVKTEGK